MKTLLQPGDKIKIREDINDVELYYMSSNEKRERWLGAEKMAKPGQLVTIKSITNGTYRINEEPMFNYTDDMFDPGVINLLKE
jgi:hypothetical protein